MDIITVEIKCSYYNRIWHITIDGKKYTTDTLAKTIGRKKSSVERSLRQLRNSKNKPEEWIRTMLWRMEQGLTPQAQVYKKGNTWWATDMIMKKCNISRSAAYERLRQWAKDYITNEQLVETPVDRHKRIIKGKDRTFSPWIDKRPKHVQERNLLKIPGPTKIERQLWGH
jgi:hypothetical protein